jgi:hypothetical protein
MGLILSVVIAELCLLISLILSSIASSQAGDVCPQASNNAKYASVISGIGLFIVFMISLFFL